MTWNKLLLFLAIGFAAANPTEDVIKFVAELKDTVKDTVKGTAKDTVQDTAKDPFDHFDEKCQPIMEANGLSKRFPGAVAHGIHSITLEDIRYYFKYNATEENHVPTLNYNLKDPRAVLPHAKLYGYDTSFYTIGMRQADQVLRDMDKKDWYLTNYNTLERLVHTIHMNEVWAKAKVHYDSISLQNVGGDVCACVKDLKHNGILKMLPFMALKIRYPGITSGLRLNIKGGQANWNNNAYDYGVFNDWSKELKGIDFGDNTWRSIENAKKSVYTIIADGDKGIHHLDNENEWKRWKTVMKGMVKRDDYELAMFLYCTLRDD